LCVEHSEENGLYGPRRYLDMEELKEHRCCCCHEEREGEEVRLMKR
jgi:hypothetical protein